MKSAFYIMRLNESIVVGAGSIHKISDQPINGFKQEEIARGHLQNLLREGKFPYSGSNSFIVLEIFNKL